jgi:hypothetical protein
MRPEISKVIEKVFYSDLIDAKSVEKLPDVRGMSQNVFVVNHPFEEDDGVQSSSKSNFVEAEFLLRLAQHLVEAGNPSTSITILTAYVAQMNCISKVIE